MLEKPSHINSAGQILQKLFEDKKSVLSPGFQYYKLEKQWSQLVGHDLASHIRPLHFRRKQLTVSVKNSTLLTESHFLRNSLIDKINNHIGSIWVEKIRFVSE